jgi:hypothetical protein
MWGYRSGRVDTRKQVSLRKCWGCKGSAMQKWESNRSFTGLESKQSRRTRENQAVGWLYCLW